MHLIKPSTRPALKILLYFCGTTVKGVEYGVPVYPEWRPLCADLVVDSPSPLPPAARPTCSGLCSMNEWLERGLTLALGAVLGWLAGSQVRWPPPLPPLRCRCPAVFIIEMIMMYQSLLYMHGCSHAVRRG